jgi:hypothetical protein
MKKSFLTIGAIMLMSIFTIVLNGCVGKDGAPGATGPQGVAGVSNISSGTVTTSIGDWIFNSTYNEWDVTIPVSDVTSDVVANGTVQAYIGDGTGNVWTALPFNYGIKQTNFEYSYGQIVIFVTNSDGSTPINPGTEQFKYVVIPSRAMIHHQNVNIKNYAEVKQSFNLN